MLPDKILSHPAIVLSEADRRFFFDQGYLVLPGFVGAAWLARLKAATAELLERSRGYSASNESYILEEGHSAATPRLHRIASPQDEHPAFWDFIRDPVMTDLAADVVGPDVTFHHAKLNVKASRGSRGFKWHQDIQAWPHTDFSPVSIGVYIDGCNDAQGPLAFVPGSHKGRLYSMYDQHGHFAVQIREDEADWITEDKIVRPTGPAGTVVLVNCRIVHGSAINTSGADRPLLLSVYSSADSFAFTPTPIKSRTYRQLVRGQPARYASFAPYEFELPPDWSAGYGAPWQRQQQAEQGGR